MTTRIRPAAATDAAAIAAVHVRSWRHAYHGLLPSTYLDALDVGQRTSLWQRLLDAPDPRSAVLLAESGADVVGFASLSGTRDDDRDPQAVGELQAVYLVPEAQRRGTGRRLLAVARERLLDLGFGTATLWVLEANAGARRFYEADGWVADGSERREEIGGVPVTELRYARPLA